MKKFLLAGILAVGSVTVQAQDKAMDPEMAKMIELGKPGAGHKVLEPFAGNWTFTVEHWMKPGDKAQVSQGTSAHTWIFGGRFLKQEVKSDMMGMPFEGLGYIGYDNLKKLYQSTWMDSMTTGIMLAEGPYDPAKKTVTLEGTFSCPMTNETARWMKSEWKLVSNDQSTYTSWQKGPDGKPYKAMVITYKRAK